MNRNRFQTAALLAALLATLRPSPARADCGEVADALLKPLIARVEACAAGKEEYEQHLAGAVKAQHDWIANLGKAKDVLAKEGQRLIDAWNKEIPLAAEAIAEIKKRVTAEIEGAYKEEKRLRGLGDNYGADLCIKNAKALDLSVTEKRASGFKKELGMLETIAGFEKFMEDRRKKIVDLEALIADCKFGMILIKEIGRGADLNTIEKLEIDAKAAITKLETGEQTYGLKAVGRGATRKEIAGMLTGAEAELAATRTRIRDGEQPVNIPTLGNITRNGLQKLIAETTEAKYAIEDTWESRRFTAMNKILGRKVTLQELEWLNISYAMAVGIEREEGEIKRAKEKLAETEQALAEHKRLYEEAVAAKQKRLDEITPLLQKTPCRLGKLMGEDPDRTALEHQRDRISKGMSENATEELDRLERHSDKIYVEEDFTPHGSLRDALANAIDDLKVTPPEPPQGFWDNVTTFKDVVDMTAAGKEGVEITIATRRVATFLDAVESLDPNSADFAARQLELLRKDGPALSEIFEKGALSYDRLQRTISTLVATGSNPELLKSLEDLERKAALFRVSTLGNLLRKGLPSGLDAAKIMAGVRSSVNGLPDAAWKGLKEMKSFERFCLFATAMGACSNVVALLKDKTRKEEMQLPEAIGRSITDFAVDLAIGGCPPAAALEVASLLVWQSAAIATGDESLSKAVFSEVVKTGVATFYDKLAETAWAAGIAGEAALTDEVLRNVSIHRLRRSVLVVEGRLSALRPGVRGEASLLRMRERFRRAIRAVEKR